MFTNADNNNSDAITSHSTQKKNIVTNNANPTVTKIFQQEQQLMLPLPMSLKQTTTHAMIIM